MQQSGENKSSQPALSSSVNEGDPGAAAADPPAEDVFPPADDGLGHVDDVEATGLSSDYYGLPSSEATIDDATRPEHLNNQLGGEESNEDNPAAAAAGAEEEADANADGKLLDEQEYNGRDKKGILFLAYVK